MTIELVQFKSAFGVACPSPFCMKVEVLLKMAKLDYRNTIIGDPAKGPKGKLPYIVDHDANNSVADSALIQSYLEQHYQIDFDAGLTDIERASSHALARMIEERLYWALVYDRWINESHWPLISKLWFGDMPPVLRTIIPMLAQRQVRRNLKGHGLGRHSVEEIAEFAKADIDALATILGNKPFMYGDVPTSIDAIAYSTLANLLIAELPGALYDAVASHDVLVGYIERCRILWFPEVASA